MVVARTYPTIMWAFVAALGEIGAVLSASPIGTDGNWPRFLNPRFKHEAVDRAELTARRAIGRTELAPF